MTKAPRDASFTSYLLAYGKTEADMLKLSKPMQGAWHDEYRLWQKNSKQEQKRRTSDEIERDTCYALLAECGVPFGPDGEPLGIGWD